MALRTEHPTFPSKARVWLVDVYIEPCIGRGPSRGHASELFGVWARLAACLGRGLISSSRALQCLRVTALTRLRGAASSSSTRRTT